MGCGEGILQWLWQDLQDAKERGATLVRVELSAKQWALLRNDYEAEGAVEFRPEGYTIFGLPVRVVPGKREPEIVAAGGMEP